MARTKKTGRVDVKHMTPIKKPHAQPRVLATGHNGFELTERTQVIPERAFAGCCVDLKKLPESVKVIEDDAFCQARGVRLTELPSQLRHLGTNAFFRCYFMKCDKLPEGLVHLGRNAFYYTRVAPEVRDHLPMGKYA